MHTQFPSLLCWLCEGILSAGAGRNLSRPGLSPPFRMYSLRSFAICTALQNPRSRPPSFELFSLQFLQFPCPPAQYDKFLSAYKHCRAFGLSMSQCRFLLLLRILRHVQPIPLAANAGAWTLLQFVVNFLVDHVCPSGMVVFNKVNSGKPVHEPGL